MNTSAFVASNATRIETKIIAAEAFCASGLSKSEIFLKCANQQSAVAPQTGLAAVTKPTWETLRKQNELSNSTSHCSIASIHTLKNALKATSWSSQELADCGFVFATTTSQIDHWQNSLPFCYHKDLNFQELTLATKYQSLGLTLVELKKQFGIQGPGTVIASSCSASLQALNIASLWIQSGKVKRCIVGTTEILSDLTIHGFNSLRLLTKSVCRPFDKDRGGINLGEASAFVCLESADLSDRPALGFVAGVGFSADAYHPTAPIPEGTGSFTAMQMALKNAHLTANEIDWIYAHGTGSIANDLAESNAIQELCKHVGARPAVSSTKSIHGHTLGACGVLEVVLATQSFKENLILPTHNNSGIDPLIPLDIVQSPRTKDLNIILKNTLGFGGINASVVLAKYSPGQSR